MKRWLIGLGVVAVLAAIVVGGLRSGGSDKGTEVQVEPAVRQAITSTVKASGEIQARVSVDISAHVVAKIERLYVVEGQDVEAGERFVDLEKEAFQAASDSWRAQVRQTETRVRQAQVDLADAEARLRRARRLTEEGITSTEALEAAELRRESASLALAEARDAVASARASLAKARDDLGKTTLYSPIAGRVVDLNAEEGEVVVSGMMNNPASKIATVADLSELLAELDVDEGEIVEVAIGQTVEVTIDAVSDRVYSGRVVEVGSSGFTRPGQGDVKFFEVDVLLEDPDPRLRPGMSLRAEIAVAETAEALVVPVQAVVERDPEAGKSEGEADEPLEVVYVVEEGVARRRPVVTGISTVTEVEIVSGLAAGEPVVVGPYRSLRDLADGDAVRVVDEDAPDPDAEDDAEDDEDEEE